MYGYTHTWVLRLGGRPLWSAPFFYLSYILAVYMYNIFVWLAPTGSSPVRWPFLNGMRHFFNLVDLVILLEICNKLIYLKYSI